jgi:uncharacterized protein YndB with AHSA1/START domain
MNNRININAKINAPVAKVWKLYTDPMHITQWNFANDDWKCPGATVDLRPGGKHTARMEAKDGSFDFDFEAMYNEVIIAEKISYTMADGRQAEIIFKANGDSTQITINFDAEELNPREMQQQGWQAILNNFKKYAEV